MTKRYNTLSKYSGTIAMEPQVGVSCNMTVLFKTLKIARIEKLMMFSYKVDFDVKLLPCLNNYKIPYLLIPLKQSHC